MMQILYNNVAKFIDEEYANDDKVYQTFESPTLITEWKLKLKYVYNFIWKQWFDNYSWSSSDFFRETKVYDGKNVFQTFSPWLGDFYKLQPITQVNTICTILVVLALLLLTIAYYIVRCMCRCCCRGKKVENKTKQD